MIFTCRHPTKEMVDDLGSHRMRSQDDLFSGRLVQSLNPVFQVGEKAISLFHEVKGESPIVRLHRHI